MHPTIHIHHHDMFADVDVKIAPIIQAIWVRDIKTRFSCQDYGESVNLPEYNGWMSIQFESEELTKFLDIVQVPSTELGLPPMPIYPYPFLTWKWEVYPVLDRHGKTKLITNVLFPQHDIDFLLTRLVVHEHAH